MTDLSTLLLDAARVLAEPPAPAYVPSEDDIDAVLRALPDMAREAMREGLPAIPLHQGEGRDTCTLLHAVAARLKAAGIPADVTVAQSSAGVPDLCQVSISVPFAPIVAYAESAKRSSWHTEAERLWKARAGADASVQIEGGAVYFWTALPSRGGKSHLTSLAVLDAAPGQAIEDAATALRLPRWTLDALGSALAALLGAESRVEAVAGRWQDGRYVPAPSLRFVLGDLDWYVDADASRDIAADDLVMQAAGQLRNSSVADPVAADAPVESVAPTPRNVEPVPVKAAATESPRRQEQPQHRPGRYSRGR